MGEIFLSAYSAKNWSYFLELWGLHMTTFYIVGIKLACSPCSILRLESEFIIGLAITAVGGALGAGGPEAILRVKPQQK